MPRDGAWGDWSSWTVCDKGCDGGKRKRHRFCDNPFPLHGGANCSEQQHETEDCNTQSCPSEFKLLLKLSVPFFFLFFDLTSLLIYELQNSNYSVRLEKYS